MKQVCASSEVVSGYDVSHYQQDLTLHAKMALQGKKFCFIKATEGVIVDDMYSKHWRAAKAAGMLVGAYNFFHPSQDPVQQANKLDQVIGGPTVIGKFGPGDLGPVIDWETTDGVPAFTDLNDGLQFLTTIKALTGKDPIIYGGPYFLQALALDQRFVNYPLWVAHYGTVCPLVPHPWHIWSFWQYTGSGGLDLNKFNGPYAQLMKFAQ